MKRVALVAGIVTLAFFLFSLAGLAFQGYALGERSAAVQADIARLRAEKEQLQAEAERLQTDKALEALARAQLGYVKEGETAVVVDFGPNGPPRAVPTPTPTPVPNWRQWLNALGTP